MFGVSSWILQIIRQWNLDCWLVHRQKMTASKHAIVNTWNRQLTTLGTGRSQVLATGIFKHRHTDMSGLHRILDIALFINWFWVLFVWFVSEQHVLLSAESGVDRVTAVSRADEGGDSHQWAGTCYLRRPGAGVFHLSRRLWARTVRHNIGRTNQLHCSPQPHAGLHLLLFWQAPLGVRTTKHRHQSPEWTILSLLHSGKSYWFCWIVFIHVVRGRLGGLLQFSKGETVKMFLASISSGIRAMWQNGEKCRAWTAAKMCAGLTAYNT